MQTSRRLWQLHRRLYLGEGGWGAEAVQVAVDLLVAGSEDPAVLELASLSPSASVAEVAPPTRALLQAHGVPSPPHRPTREQVRGYLVWACVHDLVTPEELVRIWMDDDPDWDHGRTFHDDAARALAAVDLGSGPADHTDLSPVLALRLQQL